jgi:hypothetical protein
MNSSFTFFLKQGVQRRWADCDAACKSAFPTARFVRQNNTVQALYLSPSRAEFWIALRQIDKLDEPRGHWVWLDGTALEDGGFSDWQFQQPRDDWDREDCVTVSGGSWNDVWCTIYLPCGCETDDRKPSSTSVEIGLHLFLSFPLLSFDMSTWSLC